MIKRDIKMICCSVLAGLGFVGMIIFGVGIPEKPLMCIPLFIISIGMLFVFSFLHNQIKNFVPFNNSRFYQGSALD